MSDAVEWTVAVIVTMAVVVVGILMVRPDPPKFECSLCLDIIPVLKRFDRLVTCKDDDHPVCIDCMSQYLRSNLKTATSYPQKCFHYTCKALLAVEDVRRILDEEEMVFFDKFTKLATVDHEKLVCCPSCGFPSSSGIENVNAEDEWTVLNTKSEILNIECTSCRRRFCAQCLVPWHEKQTCE